MDASWLPGNRWMRRSLIGAMVLYGWTIFGLLSSAHFFMGEEAGSGGASLADVAGHVLVFYWAWAAVTPLVLLALRRAVDRGASAHRRWTIILLATPAIVVAHSAIYLAAVRVMGVEPMSPFTTSEFVGYGMRHAGGDLATVAVLVAVYLLLDARQRVHAREVAATALEARLASANLELLRSQLQPHFLFNALNTVSTLVLKGDTAGADDAIGGISRYLRSALAQRAESTVTVGEEVEDVREYFAIERLRFGDELGLDVELSDGARGARVPALILQPLVENAIRYGMTATSSEMRVGITASIDGERLRLMVTNPGAGGATSGNGVASGEGFGLRYVRERLRQHYRDERDGGGGGDGSRDDATVTLATTSAGTVVTLDMPLVRPRAAELA